MSTDRRLGDLERQVRRLMQSQAQRPIKPPKGSSTARLYTISVTGGNTLTSGQAGIKYDTTADDAVPSAYDPSVTSTFIDGIGRGVLSINGVAQSGFVLIANAGGGGITFALVVGDVFVTSPSTVDIPVTGGGGTTVTAYIPLFM